MGFTAENDINILQSTDIATVGAGLGDDIYIISPATMSDNQEIQISDSQGSNTIQLIDGLNIAGSQISSNAVQLTLSNGAAITVLEADNFSFYVGGNVLEGTTGTVQDFTSFVTNTLGESVPTTGTISGGTVVIGAVEEVDDYHTLTGVEDTPGEQVLMWGYTPNGDGGIPVEDLLAFLDNITNLDLYELGLIDDDGVATNNAAEIISNITIGDIAADTGQVIITTNDGDVISGEASLGEDYMAFLSDLIFDANGDSRLYMETVGAGNAIVLTPSENNGATFEMAFTSDANDAIIAGRTELLHGAYIDGGGGYDILEVDMKGVYAQPLQLLNIEEVQVQNLPNVYADNGEYDDELAGSDSVLDLSRAAHLQQLTISEGYDTGVDLGTLTIVGIRNGADVTLEGGFTEDVNLHYGEGLGDAVDLTLNIGDSGENFTLNVAHNSSTLNIHSILGENAIDEANFGDGVLSYLNITGDAALYIGSDLSDSFHDDRTATIDASKNTAGVELTLEGQPEVSFIGSREDDEFTATNSDNVTIVDLAGDNILNTDNSTESHISSGEGDDEISSIATEKVMIDAGDGENQIIASAEEISVTTGADNDEITVAGTLGGSQESTTSTPTSTSINLMLILDNSGSMDGQPLADMQTAAKDLLNSFVDAGMDTAVRVVVFEGTASSAFGGSADEWLNVSDAITVIDSLTADDGTSFDAALTTAETAWTVGQGSLFTSNGINKVVFLSDGLDSVSAEVEATWESFLDDNDIEANAFGFGEAALDNLEAISSLEPIAYDGANGIQLVPIIVDDTADLADVVVEQVAVIEVPGNEALIEIDAGAGENIINLGNDDDLTQGLVALEDSYITGENITLVVNQTSNITQAALTGVTAVDMHGGELTITATQFEALAADGFTVDGAAFGTMATLHIDVLEDAVLSDLVNFSLFSANIDLTFNIKNGSTLTLSAEELHYYVSEGGIDSTDGLNGKVVITDAGLNFDAFDNGDDFQVPDAGSLTDNFDASEDVTIIRTSDGFNRPEPDPSTDIWSIDTTGEADPVILTDADIEDGDNDDGVITTNVKSLEITGDQDLSIEASVDLADNFTVDFSDLTGSLTMTLANFQDISASDTVSAQGEIMGNGTDEVPARLNIELADSSVTGAEGNVNGFKSSGVQTYVVTDIYDVDSDDPGPEISNRATVYLCDNSQDVTTVGLRGNYDDTIIFRQVNWGINFLLEGDGNLDYTSKANGNPAYSNIGTLNAEYFWEGAPAVVTINNQGTNLTEGPRALHVEGINIANASSITVNIQDGDAVIASINNDEAFLDGNDGVESLIFTSANDVTVQGNLNIGDDGDGLAILDASAVEGDFIFEMNNASHNDLSDTAVTGIDALIFADPDAELSMTVEQMLAVGLDKFSTSDADGENGTLNVMDLADEVIDLGAVDVGNIGDVTITDNDEDGLVVLNAETNLGGADTVTINALTSDTTLQMTADQFHQICADVDVNAGNRSLICGNAGDAFESTLLLTDLAEDEVIDLALVDQATIADGDVDDDVVNVVIRVDGVTATDEMEITNGTATLEVGAGDSDLTAAMLGETIEEVVFVEDGTLTLTADQVLAISTVDEDNDGVADNFSLADGVTATLNITDLSTQALDLDAIAAAGINIGEIVIADLDSDNGDDVAIVLDPDTTLGDADTIITPTADINDDADGLEDVSVTMTAAQFLTSSGIITGDAMVNITDLANNVDTDADYDLDSALINLSGISAPNGVIDLGDSANTVTLDLLSDLGGFTINLDDGQMIRFTTEDQASGTEIVVVDGTTAVAWLFDTVASEIDTSNYDSDIDTLYVNDLLVDGANVEALWNFLPGTIIVEVVNSAEIPDVLVSIDRTVVVDALTSIDGLTFDDQDELQTIANLTIDLQGNTDIGDLVIDDTLGEGDFETLTILSTEDRTTLADDNGFGFEPNQVGDISLSDVPSNELVDITLDTGTAATNATDDITGLDLEVGTITFGADDAESATLTLAGENDITIAGVDISDLDLEMLHIDATGFSYGDDADIEIGGINQDDAGDAVVENAENIYLIDGNDDGFVADDTAVFGSDVTNDLIQVVNGDVDLTNADVSEVEGVLVSSDGTLTMTAAQIAAVGEDNFTLLEGVAVTLNVTELGNDPIDLNSIQDAGFNIGEVSTVEDSDGQIDTVLADGTTLGGADQLTILLNDEDNTLTLTTEQYQQITDGNLVEADMDNEVENAASVTITDLAGIADAADRHVDIDLSTVAVTGAQQLQVADAGTAADVIVSETSDLAGFSIVLDDVDDDLETAADNAAGQTIRFSTAVQAERDIIVTGFADDDADTNVVWLFDSITGTQTANKVDTSGYSSEIGRLWMTDLLVDGANVEELYTSLASDIIVHVVPDALDDALPATTGFDRTVEIEAFTQIENGLTFNDIDSAAEQPFDHVENLTISMGGDVNIGDLKLDNILAVDELSNDDEFETLTLNSLLADVEGHVLLPEDYVQFPSGNNVVGDISSGLNRGELHDVTINALEVGLEAGTITFTDDGGLTPDDEEDDDPVATLSVTGSHDVEILSVNTDDADITDLVVDTTDYTGTLYFMGASPALQMDNTESLSFVGQGNIVLGQSPDTDVVNEGIFGDELSLIDLSDFTGTINLGEISQIDSSNDEGDQEGSEEAAFTFISGSGVTTMTLTDVELDDDSQWVFDFSGAAEGSVLTLTEDADLDDGSTLTIILGANGLLEIDGDVDLTAVNLTIVDSDTSTPSILVTEDSELTLSKTQVSGLVIDPDSAGTVEYVDNEPPVFSNTTVEADEDQIYVDTLNQESIGYDPDGDTDLTFILVEGSEENGTVVLLEDGRYRFTPDSEFAGTASFDYMVTDGWEYSTTQTVTLNYSVVNDAPEVLPVYPDPVLEDTVLTGTLEATDVDSTSFTFAAVNSAAGIEDVVVNDDGTFEVTFTENFSGQTSFRYTATDDGATGDTTPATSDPGTVYINVTAVNDAPVLGTIDDMTVASVGSQTLTGQFLATDVDNDVADLTFTVSGVDDALGELALKTDGSYVYTPMEGVAGEDTFTITVSDGVLTDSQDVTVTVFANTAPVVEDVTYEGSVDEDSGTVTGVDALPVTDAENNDIIAYTVSNEVGGSATVAADGTWSFELTENFNGTASFDYTASDEYGTSDPATVSITVNPVNDAPVIAEIADYTTAITENDADAIGTVVGTAAATDVDNDGDVFSGAFSLTDDFGGMFAIDSETGEVTVATALDYEAATAGLFTLEVVATDDDDALTGTEQFTVAVANDPSDDNAVPVVEDVTYEGSVDEDSGTVTGVDALPVTDAENNDIIAYTVSNEVGGSATVAADGTWSFELTENFNGTAGFDYTASDEYGTSDPATVSITVNAVNDAPVLAEIADYTAGIMENDLNGDVANSTVVGTASATDVDEADGVFAGTFSLTDDFGGLFAISADGQVTVAGALDFDATGGSYTLEVVADDGALTATDQFTVTVLDDDDVEDVALDDLGGILTNPAATSGEGKAFNFIDRLDATSNTEITGFGADDQLTLVGVTLEDLGYQESDGNVQIEFDDGAGTTSRITLMGVAVGSFNAQGFIDDPDLGDIVFA